MNNHSVAHKKDTFVGILFLVAGIYFLFTMAVRMITSYEQITLMDNILPSLFISILSTSFITYGVSQLTYKKIIVVLIPVIFYASYLAICFG